MVGKETDQEARSSNMSNTRCVTPSESSTIDAHDGDRWKETQSRWNKMRMRDREKSGRKKKRARRETWEEMHPPRHSWAHCHVGLSHGIWLEILVLSVSSKQKIGHILFNTATAWHSFTVEHNTHDRTWHTASKRIVQRGEKITCYSVCVLWCSRCYVFIPFWESHLVE